MVRVVVGVGVVFRKVERCLQTGMKCSAVQCGVVRCSDAVGKSVQCTHSLTHPLTVTHSHSLTHSQSFVCSFVRSFVRQNSTATHVAAVAQAQWRNNDERRTTNDERRTTTLLETRNPRTQLRAEVCVDEVAATPVAVVVVVAVAAAVVKLSKQ